MQVAILRSFWRLNIVSCERVAIGQVQVAILPQFLAIEHRFVRKGCDWTREIAILLHWRLKNRFSCETVAPDTYKSQFYPSFWRSNFISCERVAPDTYKSQFYHSFWRSNLISCERVAIGHQKSQFYLSFWLFGGRTSFRVKGLHFVASRWHCPVPSREK